MTERIDTWLRSGEYTRTSLACYRIIYATVMLLVLPNFGWVAAFPDSMYVAPPGPFRLFDGFPPSMLLNALEAALAVSLVAILIGWRTRLFSYLAVGIAMTAFGFVYSLGKIDHDILQVLVPGLMAPAGWGDRLSVDALRRGDLPAPPERAEQWPLRIFALLIGLAFLTAALPKIRGGWLAWDSQAVQAMQARHHLTNGREELLSGVFLQVENRVFWETMDLATILLEALLVVAVLSWRSTRVALAVTTTFHLGVWLMMGIPFIQNVVSYAFAVRWNALPVPAALRRRVAALARDEGARRSLVRAAPAVVLVGGVSWASLIEAVGNAEKWMYPLILVLGGVIAGAYLLRLAVAMVTALRPPGDAAAGRLLYDQDCGFCSRWAQWLSARRPDRVRAEPARRSADLAALGLTSEDITARAYWVGSGGELSGGSRAIAAALVARGGAALPLGRLIASPFVLPASEAVYQWVAARRHQMPGSTGACAVPTPPDRVGDARPEWPVVDGGRP